jgi:energy-coupling factor transport system ATP-binding protein
MRKLQRQAVANGLVSPLSPDQGHAELHVDSVSHRWPNGDRVLNRCNLTIQRPGLWMLVGSNGSGKSTLFRLIAGLLEPQAGSIECKQRAALVFQNPDHQLLLPSCGSDLLLGIRSNQSMDQRRQRVEACLNQLGLHGLATRPIHTLSGGQKQRLAIAGALASNAGLLLLDEPTALLDPQSQRAVLSAVHTLCHQPTRPITALWITHRLEELNEADGAAQMHHGRIGPWTTGRELRQRLQSGRSDR